MRWKPCRPAAEEALAHEAELQRGRTELEAGKTELEVKKAELAEGRKQLVAGKAELEKQKTTVEEAEKNWRILMNSLPAERAPTAAAGAR